MELRSQDLKKQNKQNKTNINYFSERVGVVTSGLSEE